MNRVPPSVFRKPAIVFTTASSIALFGLSSRRSQRAVDLNSTATSSSLSIRLVDGPQLGLADQPELFGDERDELGVMAELLDHLFGQG